MFLVLLSLIKISLEMIFQRALKIGYSSYINPGECDSNAFPKKMQDISTILLIKCLYWVWGPCLWLETSYWLEKSYFKIGLNFEHLFLFYSIILVG